MGGTSIITVELTDLADGMVIADAIHVSRGAVYPPPAAPAPSDLALLARWVAASQEATDSDDGDAEAGDLVTLDHLFKLLGDG